MGCRGFSKHTDYHCLPERAALSGVKSFGCFKYIIPASAHRPTVKNCRSTCGAQHKLWPLFVFNGIGTMKTETDKCEIAWQVLGFHGDNSVRHITTYRRVKQRYRLVRMKNRHSLLWCISHNEKKNAPQRKGFNTERRSSFNVEITVVFEYLRFGSHCESKPWAVSMVIWEREKNKPSMRF